MRFTMLLSVCISLVSKATVTKIIPNADVKKLLNVVSFAILQDLPDKLSK